MDSGTSLMDTLYKGHNRKTSIIIKDTIEKPPYKGHTKTCLMVKNEELS